MIHEGTAGIHAKTLLGRKVQSGKANVLFEAMRTAAAEAEEVAATAVSESAKRCLSQCAASLRAATTRAEHVTATLTSKDVDRAVALTNAHDYLTLMGHTTIAWTWLRIATAAAQQQHALGAAEAGGAADMFYQGKLHTAEWFFRHELPKCETLASLLLSLDLTNREMRPGWF